MHLLLPQQQRVHALILSLVPNWSDADDLLQRTITVMWRKFDEFRPGTDFAAWAMSIARWEVMDFRKRHALSKLQFTDESIEAILERMMRPEPRPGRRAEALRSCLSKLSERDRQLVQLRYELGATTKSVAQRIGRSIDTVYKSLNRIRGQLLRCIQTTLAQEGVR